MKKFWKKTEGFTLVELIVVIAILGILAGVGTVGYSGYIKKANMAADQQLASGVANILQLEHYADMNASGYVILSKDKAPSVEDKTISEGLVEVLETAFGDLGALKLKSDEWAISNEMLEEALAAGEAVGNSSYVKNNSISELLGNVQTVTSAASEVLGGKARSAEHMVNLLEMSLGTGYLEKAAAAGVIDKDDEGNYSLKEGTYTPDGSNVKLTKDLQNQLSNLMVFSVADQLKNADTYTMQNLMLVGLVNGAEIPEGYSEASALAARYALFKAYAGDNGKEADLKELDAALFEASNAQGGAMDAVKDAFDVFVEKNSEGMDAYLMNEDGLTDVFNTNADAVASIMKGVTAVEGNYGTASALANGNLYTSGGVAGDLTNFINVAGMDAEAKAALRAVIDAAGTDAAGGMIISVGPNGVSNPSLS